MSALPSNLTAQAPAAFSSSLHRASTQFPRIWPGFALAAVVLLLELCAGIVTTIGLARVAAVMFLAAFLPYWTGLIWWYRWLYCVHKILAEATGSTYSISPKKAIGYRFIPFYNFFVWNFKWTNKIADFVRLNSTKVGMARFWPGIFLMLATLLAIFDKGLELVLLFSVSAYLAGKIRGVLPHGFTRAFAASPHAESSSYVTAADETGAIQYPVFAFAQLGERPRRISRHEFVFAKDYSLPISSGVGAAFGFLMCYGLWLSEMAQKTKVGTFALNILVVAIVLYFFLDPLAEKLLEAFGAADQHLTRTFWKGMFRFAVFAVILDVSHSLLERAAEESGGIEVAQFCILFTLFFGGMTYLWIVSGSRQKLPEALAFVGLGTVVLLFFGLAVVGEAGHLSHKLSGAEIQKDYDALKQPLQELKKPNQLPADLGSSTQEIGEEIVQSKDPKKTIAQAIGLLCAVFVAMAGFTAMRMRFKPVVVAGAVFLTAGISGSILGLTSLIESFHIVTALWSPFWWCLGMLVFYDHKVLYKDLQTSSSHQEADGQELPRPVWLVCLLILVGLICAAYRFHPPGHAIGGRTLTVYAADTERPYGSANPPFKHSSVGLTGSDTEQSVLKGEPSLSSAATIDSPPGTYPIAVGPGSAKTIEDKYRVRFVPGNLKVVPASTRTNVVSNAPNAVVNSPVTFTALIVPQASGIPSGSVTFYADASPLGKEPVSDGIAFYTVTALPVGTHSVTAKYSGDANFKGSTSPEWKQQISPPQISRPVATTVVLPKGKEIYIANVHPIDTNTSEPYEPLIALLAAPISVDGHLLAPKGATAILALSDIDREGHLGGKPSLTIHLMQLKIAGQTYKLQSTLEVEGAPQGRAGHVYIPAAAILTFKLQSPVTIDISSLPTVSRRPLSDTTARHP